MEQTILNNGTYVQISVSENQKIFARQLVEHSLHHHKVANIWDRQLSEFSKSRLMRYTGTLGEVVFADAYHLPRPVHSFGASSGQDLGQDFEITSSDSHKFSIDIKSMKRHSGVLSGHYVLNIQAVQLHRNNSKTSHYFCISFHQSEKEGTIASLLGFVDKQSLEDGHLGSLFKAGTIRARADGSSFVLRADTYEIMLSEIAPPVITDYITRLPGFKICDLIN
ncbi:hypothetical protein DSL64_00860 [Dyadobacter luteus]|uniref:Uncharacterized protein n=1 Tax=Dyadobacter luteus TaxID=2259619 RepID=A0A3D8YI02_9BACT|nr:hypothetical protein [Dyadobacter luteus]REA64137.1 hypothetical protein DSL64_00860 [Dyadobacter luteus]